MKTPLSPRLSPERTKYYDLAKELRSLGPYDDIPHQIIPINIDYYAICPNCQQQYCEINTLRADFIRAMSPLQDNEDDKDDEDGERFTINMELFGENTWVARLNLGDMVLAELVRIPHWYVAENSKNVAYVKRFFYSPSVISLQDVFVDIMDKQIHRVFDNRLHTEYGGLRVHGIEFLDLRGTE